MNVSFKSLKDYKSLLTKYLALKPKYSNYFFQDLNQALFAAVSHVVMNANAAAAAQAATSFARFVFTRNLGCWG